MARSQKEPQPLYPPVKSEVRRQNNDWWVRCPKDNWLEAGVCQKSFLEVNALKNNRSHHCYNCHNGKEYRIMMANGVFDRTFHDMLYGERRPHHYDADGSLGGE